MKRKCFLYNLLLVGAASCAFTTSFAQNNEAKIEALLKKMTLEEKVNMIHGVSSFNSGGVARLGIPELVTSDGPHGVRIEHGRDWTPDKNVFDSGTYLPTGNTLAATWNPQLGFAYGKVLGSEAKYRGKDVILGPGINIIRTPLNGRNFEYMSEDPYLIAKMVVGYVQGVQSEGISACVKHYMANNQETKRTTVNVLMSERALREIYLPGFKAAVVEGKVNTIMGAYNKFRGQYCTHNDYLVNKILKGEWGFKGIMMSDWGAVHNTLEAIHNGTDLEMGTDIGTPPFPYNKFYLADTVVRLVKSGKVAETLINDKVRRILRIMYQTNMIEGKRTPGYYGTKNHQMVAQAVAEEGIVLLKNEQRLLPLSRDVQSIAVIGENAFRKNALGGGSSQVKPTYEITPLVGLQQLVGNKTNITYSRGFKIERNAKADPKLIQEAAAAAAKAEVAIVVGGWVHGYNYSNWDDNAYDAEGIDKPDMKMPFGQDELIEAVVKANPNTIVVLIGAGGIEMGRWVNKTKSIVQAWYPGMDGGTALARLLFGEVNPSGKLPMSLPKKLEDCPAHKLGDFPGDSIALNYKEDIFVGYRYYDTYKIAPEFAFGHGLSYTTFEYSALIATKKGTAVTVTLNIKNAGKMAGAEVVQLYVKEQAPSVPRPEKELKGFQKIQLQPGESKKVTLTLPADAFQYFDEKANKFVLHPGKFQLLVGSSSKDIRLSTSIVL